MADIKEMKEAIIGVNELAIFLISLLKDGVGIDDATAVLLKMTTDEEFKKKIVDAYEGCDKIKAEWDDLDVNEGVELGLLIMQYIPKYSEALKKEEVPA